MALVSNNGTPFQSKKSYNFISKTSIMYHYVPLYHPSSNGLAENMVKTVKQALRSSRMLIMRSNIAWLLALYHNTWHATTLRTPAKLLLT